MPHILVTIAIVTVLSSSQILGCDCPERKLMRFSKRVRLAFASAEIVFVGTVIHVEERPGTEYFRKRWATFTVEKTLKGRRAKERAVWTAIPCGFRFQEGEKYLIYGTRYRGTLYTDRCNRSVLITAADQREMELLTRLGVDRH